MTTTPQFTTWPELRDFTTRRVREMEDHMEKVWTRLIWVFVGLGSIWAAAIPLMAINPPTIWCLTMAPSCIFFAWMVVRWVKELWIQGRLIKRTDADTELMRQWRS